MEREKSAEDMWKQIFQIQKCELVNWKLKWDMNILWDNHYWKLKKTTVSKLEAVAHVFCGNGILRNFAGQPTT